MGSVAAQQAPPGPDTTDPAKAARGLTVRAVVLGLLGAATLGAVGYFNDYYLGMTPLGSNHFPPVVYGSVVFLLLTVNPLLGLLHKRWKLAAGEWAVVLSLMLGASVVATNGLARGLPPVLAMPGQLYRTNPAWQEAEVMRYLPRGLVVCDGRYDETVIGGYVGGMRLPDRSISPGQVPWAAWKWPLVHWGIVVVLALLAGTCLAAIVVPQWAARERLAFPIASFATALLTGRDDEGASILRNRWFWILLSLSLGIHVVNGLHAWWPQFFQIPLDVPLYGPLIKKWPSIAQTGLAWTAFSPHIYFIVLGLSFFLSREASFTMGVAPYLEILVTWALLMYGINPRGGRAVGSYESYLRFGAYLGMMLMVLYSGRSYYAALARRAVGLGRPGPPVAGVWAARVLVLSSSALSAVLWRLGLDWPLAVAMVLILLMVYVMLARINAETGLFFVVPDFGVFDMPAALLGFYALGPQAMLVGMLAATVLSADLRSAVTPTLINGLEACRRQGIRTPRVARWALVGALVAAAIAVPVALYINYNWGAVAQADQWSVNTPAAHSFKITVSAVNQLRQAGQLDPSLALSPLERLMQASPVEGLLPLAAAGIAGVILLSALRLRYSWWPIHPMLLVVYGAWPLARFGPSFLAGWLLRSLVLRFASPRACQRLKPAMIGLIAGELLAICLWMAVDWIYYAQTGIKPPAYRILPE